MKKIFFKFFILLSIIHACLFHQIQSLDQSDSLLKDYTEINCELKPIIRRRNAFPDDSIQHSSYPHFLMKMNSNSYNWSGYVTLKKNQRVNSVSKAVGSWFIPALANSKPRGYCAIWVGIDGFQSETVEQIGTEHDWVNGRQQNYAWFEMFPRSAFLIQGFPVNVGNLITASVIYEGNDTFRLALVNHNHKVYSVIPRAYTKIKAQRSSAEWIVEAPFLNGILPLANFRSIKFINCMTTINGVTGAINNNRWTNNAMNMITNNNITKAISLKLNSSGKSFNVAWKHR